MIEKLLVGLDLLALCWTSPTQTSMRGKESNICYLSGSYCLHCMHQWGCAHDQLLALISIMMHRDTCLINRAYSDHIWLRAWSRDIHNIGNNFFHSYAYSTCIPSWSDWSIAELMNFIQLITLQCTILSTILINIVYASSILFSLYLKIFFYFKLLC